MIIVIYLQKHYLSVSYFSKSCCVSFIFSVQEWNLSCAWWYLYQSNRSRNLFKVWDTTSAKGRLYTNQQDFHHATRSMSQTLQSKLKAPTDSFSSNAGAPSINILFQWNNSWSHSIWHGCYEILLAGILNSGTLIRSFLVQFKILFFCRKHGLPTYKIKISEIYSFIFYSHLTQTGDSR